MHQRILINNAPHKLDWLLSTRAGQALLAHLYETKQHPFCNCVKGNGVKMYVARRGDHFYVARMPYSGSLHAPDCGSVEDVNFLTGITSYAPEAITEQEDGQLVVNLSAPLTGITPVPSLSLSGLFDLLIEQAGLNRYHHHSGAVKVTWASVRDRLLAASEKLSFNDSQAAADSLLVVPKPYDKDLYASDISDFEARLRTAKDVFLCAPLKEIRQSAYGWLLVLKHLPHFRFWISHNVATAAAHTSHGQFQLDFPPRFALCLCSVRANKTPGSFTVNALSIKATDAFFMPCANERFSEVAATLREEGASFVRVLRFDAPPSTLLADYALLDATMTPVFVDAPSGDINVDSARRSLAGLFAKNGCPARFFRFPSHANEKH